MGLAGGLLLAILGVGASELPLEIDERQRFYRVDALDGERLRQQIDAGRPVAGNGRPSHGLLLVDLALDYQLLPAPGGCVLQAPRVRLETELWLPVWQPAGDPDPALVEAWQRMLAGLVEHEDGHRRLVFEGARELAARVGRMAGEVADCGALRRELLGLRLAAGSRLALRNATYDRRTGHGIRQGAVLDLKTVGLDPCGRRDSRFRSGCGEGGER